MTTDTLDPQIRIGFPAEGGLCPLETHDPAALSLHSSLVLTDILRTAQQVLQKDLPLERLTFVQHRATESTATLYALENDAGASLIGPIVCRLEESRLKQCLATKGRRTAQAFGVEHLDTIERQYLTQGETRSVVYVPLVLGHKNKGVLVLALRAEAPKPAALTSLLTPTTAHLAQAIDNSDRLYFQCRRGRQLSMVGEIARQAVIAEELGAFLVLAAELIRDSLNYSTVQIWTPDRSRDGLTLAARTGLQGSIQPACAPEMATACAAQMKSLCENQPPAHSDSGSGSRLATPIHLRGRLIGVLFVESSRLDAFTKDDLGTMEVVASLIASVWDNLRAFARAQESNEYMQAILESAKHLAILSTDPLGYVLTSSIGSEKIFQLSQRQSAGRDLLTLFTDPRFHKELTAYMSNGDVPTLEKTRLAQEGQNGISYLNVSLQRVLDLDKKVMGFLCIAQDVSENLILERRLEALSITDELTGLYNRRQFFATITAEIERCQRFQRNISLCFFDLDRFKQFNDTHGHLRGDQALEDTAKLILGTVRSKIDTCYRYGGDEFTIIMPETTIDMARVVAERIREKLLRESGHELSASIGIASSAANVAAETLIEKADQAMYDAKSLGGNCTVLAK